MKFSYLRKSLHLLSMECLLANAISWFHCSKHARVEF